MRGFPRFAPVFFAACLLLTSCVAPTQPEVRAGISAVEAMGAATDPGWARAATPRPFVFPTDHGPHQEFAIEWWYWTGNVKADGRHFGYQLTIFRRGLVPQPTERASSWAASNIYMAHFALSDVAGERFYAFERFSRDAAGLAGADGEPFQVFVDDWVAEGSGPEGMSMRLRAAEDDVAIDLTLENTRPPTLQGDRGLSQKGAERGNASYYYSLTRMATSGTVTIGAASYPVSGLSWMDREWSTSALDRGVVGWDWFALHLDSGEDLMAFQLRTADGSVSPFNYGSLTSPDGTVRHLSAAELQFSPQGSWRSDRSGATYPAGWRIQAPTLGLDLTLEPFLADQELPVSVVYWEGAVRIGGTRNGRPIAGSGYMELTGYGDSR